MPSPERRVDDTVSQEYESMVLEAVKSLGLQADFVEDTPKIRMWRVYTEFGKLLIRIEGSHLLKLQVIYARPDELSPASALVFANKWNLQKRFTKLAVHTEDNTVMQLEYDADLQHAQLAAVREMIEIFRRAMLTLVFEMHNELK